MTDLLRFAGEHPILAAILAWIASQALTAPFTYAYRAYNLRLRSVNIRLHGWPTAPIDADGDVVYPEKEEDDGDSV